VSPGLARWLVRLYPRVWRIRYGAEFEVLLVESRGGWRTALDVLGSALYERVVPPLRLFLQHMGGLFSLEVTMDQYPESVLLLGRKPSAFVPVAMSVAALAVVLVAVASSSNAIHESDEGAAAHLWQLLMAGQIPVLLYFVIRWMPRVPRQALIVLALQAFAALAAIAPVYFLGL
jgi:hypothetical protein